MNTIENLILEDFERTISVSLRSVFAVIIPVIKYLPGGGE
ncbi:protein of unknown function [Xenorhabdus poinarii G6]|uniref:Uncharacterized protein n=1 Tax=Xenorhabdus poinarii G6 TaxID=1354304 RepID=A0A068R645_9GAMM|nr:protein of unknown function [Xenorhabdus poinarii G6]